MQLMTHWLSNPTTVNAMALRQPEITHRLMSPTIFNILFGKYFPVPQEQLATSECSSSSSAGSTIEGDVPFNGNPSTRFSFQQVLLEDEQGADYD